jgi:hypothetical protein
MSTQHVIHDDKKQVTLDERSSKMYLSVAPKSVWPDDFEPYESLDLDPLDLARMALKMIKVASYHPRTGLEGAFLNDLVRNIEKKFKENGVAE